MRVELEKRHGQRLTFQAKVERLGKKTNYKGYPESTILLLDLKDENGNDLCDHVWMNYQKRFKKADLHVDDFIQFKARIGAYEKGYSKHDEYNPKRIDFKLNNPTQITVLNRISDIKLGVELKEESEHEIVNLLNSARIQSRTNPTEIRVKKLEMKQKTLFHFFKKSLPLSKNLPNP